jgi:tRNA-specific 2-thiouridylase
MLKNDGHAVEGILLKQVNEPDSDSCDDYVCCAETAIARARDVCDRLDIPLHTPDVRKIFNDKVIRPSLLVWGQGGVPSPCTTCNADVRAPLLNYYRQVLECDYFATGHYFGNIDGKIFRGVDPKKDQSYMVSLVDRAMFKNWLTPLGRLSKTDVRRMATEWDVPTATTPDSQNLCFNHLLPSFDRKVLKRSSEGELIQIGTHNGRPAIGQRKGFGGSTVLEVSSDRIVVGDSAIGSRRVPIVWKVPPYSVTGSLTAQVAYHGTAHHVVDIDGMSITLATDVIASAGQVVAVYCEDELVGGGVIQFNGHTS